jgi:hypothetical protein
MTILDALRDPNLFHRLFQGQTWHAWSAFLACLFGLPMDDEQRALAQRCTGRADMPTTQAREAALIVGRRGGKSYCASLIAIYLSCCRTYAAVLSPGEMGVVMLIASDRKQARVLRRYVGGLLRSVPMLAQMIANETAEGIELTNRIILEIHTASYKAVRGYTVIACIADEVAFWPTDESSNPDTEIIQALRPAGATVPGFLLLLLISTPYARKGELWKAYKNHFGKDGDPVLVWQADTRTMNPLVPQSVLDHAYQDDESAASAEYGAQFRRDIDVFISREVVDACVISGRYELPPGTGRSVAGIDPAGGSSGDSMTGGIARADGDRVVLECLREWKPPFSPEQVVAEFAVLLKRYRITTVVGDRWGGEWCREPFRKHGILYQIADKTKSELYQAFLPLLNSQTVDLLDHPRLISQLCGLERRTARGGKDSIDHGPGPHGHDDVVNACALAVYLAKGGAQVPGIFLLDAPRFGDEHVFPRLG